MNIEQGISKKEQGHSPSPIFAVQLIAYYEHRI